MGGALKGCTPAQDSSSLCTLRGHSSQNRDRDGAASAPCCLCVPGIHRVLLISKGQTLGSVGWPSQAKCAPHVKAAC